MQKKFTFIHFDTNEKNLYAMKNFKLYFFFLSVVLLTACSKKDDPAPDVTGTWTITEGIVESASITIDMGGMPIPMEIEGNYVDIDPENWLKFASDHTFSSYTGNISLELKISTMGTSTTERFAMNDVFGNGTWSQSGRTLNIENENGTTIPYQITSHSENNLELTANVKDMMPSGGSNPFVESMDVNVKIKLARI